MTPIQIRARALARFALPSLCRRCAYLGLHSEQKMPFQIFPSILSGIDRHSKRVVDCAYQRANKLPGWLSDFPGLEAPIVVPNHSKFFAFDPTTAITLTGAPDQMYRRIDRSVFIADFKCAQQSGRSGTSSLLASAQLASSAFIANHAGYGPVSGMGLIYTDPAFDLSPDQLNRLMQHDGFYMRFRCRLVEVVMKTAPDVPTLLKMARDLYDGPLPPPKVDCDDCRRMARLFWLVEGYGQTS